MILAGTFESDVALRDGATVHVRPVRADDAARLEAFFALLSDRSRYWRFFTAGVDVPGMARQFASSPADRGLIAVTGDDTVVAHGDYVPEGDGKAEIAFAVAEAWQGHGVATILLGQLAEAAAAEGITRFAAIVMPDNRRMINVFRDSGFTAEVRSTAEGVAVEFPTALDTDGRQRAEDRRRAAAVAAVRHVLEPGSIVVVGASAREGAVGTLLMNNLATFTGPVYAVNRRAGPLRSVADVPGSPELAVVAVPAADVPGVARDCAAKGVRALIVISGDFAEAGAAGMALQGELLQICRTSGMRLLGPNCLGAFNTDPAVALNATFASVDATPGTVAFASQSGAFGITGAGLAARRGIGLSAFVSLGNKADLSGNDVLQAWERDPRTAVIALYLESFGNPHRFGRISRRITQTKPIVVVKAGRSTAGKRAAASHTAALAAGSDANVDALFRHAGIIRTDTVAEMFDTAAVLARQPLPRGGRVAIVTNAGGPGILGADACEAAGLTVAALSQATQAALRGSVPRAASVANPVDLVATATPAELRNAIAILVADPEVDAVIAAHVAIVDDVAEAIAILSAPPAGTPVLGVLLGATAPPGTHLFDGVEEAARALGHAVAYARHRAAPPDPTDPPPGIDADRAAAIIAAGLARGGDWLAPEDVTALLDCYGVPLAPSRLVRSPSAVRRAATELGGCVALKAVAPGLVHKSERSAVRLNLGPTAAERAARELQATIGELEAFLVQPMAPPGAELLVGTTTDSRFGPLVAVGAGGTTAELAGDAQLRLAPVGPREAAAMLRELRCFPLLDGFRGRPVADTAAVEALIVRIGALAAAHPAVAELDCNPVIAGPGGALVVDARIRLQAPPPSPPFGALDA